jgi:hypothetical protein
LTLKRNPRESSAEPFEVSDSTSTAASLNPTARGVEDVSEHPGRADSAATDVDTTLADLHGQGWVRHDREQSGMPVRAWDGAPGSAVSVLASHRRQLVDGLSCLDPSGSGVTLPDVVDQPFGDGGFERHTGVEGLRGGE